MNGFVSEVNEIGSQQSCKINPLSDTNCSRGKEPSESWQVEIGAIQSIDGPEEDEDTTGTTSLTERAGFKAEIGSDDSDSMLVDAIPNLPEQRIIIGRLWEEFVRDSQEGDKVYILPSKWSNMFFDQQENDYTVLGPIDISSTVVDHDNFVLAAGGPNTYISVPEPVFMQLRDWYGIVEGSEPVYTVLVKDSQGQLIVEYDRPKFRVHFLTCEEDISNPKYGIRSPIFFTLSRLSTMEDVVTKAMKLFCERESYIDIDKTIFRTWYVKDRKPSENNSNEYLQTNYKLTPSAFIELPVKQLIKADQFSHTVREYDTHTIDLVVEVKGGEKGRHWASNYYIYNQMDSPKGTVGLANLGNTCYMNSALQCLVHIPEFKDYFLYNAYENEINVENPLGHKGHIAWAFGLLVSSLFGQRNSNLTTYLPRNFKTTISHLNSMFAGYQQQDSQEFLAFLLDGLHEDLNRIAVKPYVEKPELSPEDDITKFETIKKLADDTWLKHRLRNDSVIMDLFVGLYKSTLTCPSCQKVSITFDPYNDLTLPLPVDSTWSTTAKIFPYNAPPYTLEVELKKTNSYNDLKEYISRCTGINAEYLLGAEVFNHQFYNNYEASNANSQYLPIHELISDSDVVVFYEVPRRENDIVIPVMNTIIEDGFKSAKLCGFPFFISLSEEEQSSYGAILTKLEHAFKNFSGGYDKFPLSSKKQNKTLLEFLPKLREKYSQIPLEALEAELKYANPGELPNKFFNLKIYDGTSVPFRQQYNVTPGERKLKNEIWTPEPHVTFTKYRDVAEMLPQYVKDCHCYHEFDIENQDNNTDESNLAEEKALRNSENVETGDLDAIPKKAGQLSDSDMDIEESEINPNENRLDGEVEDQAKCVKSENGNISVESLRWKLVEFQYSLVCEWKTKSYEEVFSNTEEPTWDNPGKRINEELEKSKRKLENQEEKKITLHDCLSLFAKPEVLGATDSWYCPNCKVHRQATKQIELWNTPDILLIHLKRFENQRSFSDKIADVVHFPITNLDMSPYVVHQDDKSNIYDLVAVDNHYGGLGGGHYTAYVKNFVDNKWYYFDDSRVNETVPERSIAGSAYLLFYRRRTKDEYLGGRDLSNIIMQARRKSDARFENIKQLALNLYSENKSDQEDDEEDADDNERMSEDEEEGTEKQGSTNFSNILDGKPDSQDVNLFKGTISPKSDYSIASLEVGTGPNVGGANENDHNNSRRKLRLLQKTYTCQATTMVSPEPTSCSSNVSMTDENNELTKTDRTSEGLNSELPSNS